MATAWFGPCPHCAVPLSYLEGVTGSTFKPSCPRCKVAVDVKCATFLMVDHSRRLTARVTPKPKQPRVDASR